MTQDFVLFDGIDKELELQEIKEEEDDAREESEASKVNSSINHEPSPSDLHEELKFPRIDTL